MRGSMRYGLAGISGLGLLTIGHWLRDLALPPQRTVDYLLGVIPNFAAAIAITFVLLSIWSDQYRDASFATTLRALLVSASISGVGLISWELIQGTSNRLVFDPHDIGATLVGVATAAIMFYLLTPGSRSPP